MTAIHRARPLLPMMVAAAVLSAAGAAIQQRPARPLDERSIRFRSSVDLVRLSVTARNQDGQIARDLQAEDFEVYEDGVRQNVRHFGHEETPISVVLLLDKSTSMMAGDKFMHAKDAVVNFVRALKRGETPTLLATRPQHALTAEPLTRLVRNPATFHATWNFIESLSSCDRLDCRVMAGAGNA